MKKIAAAALVLALTAPAVHAASGKLALCVYDPLAQAGDIYRYAKDYALQMPRFGILTPNELKAYSNENQLISDFKSGKCDLAMITTLRANEFNKYIYSMTAIGGLTSKEDVNLALQVLTSKNVAAKMSVGDYEVIGMIPMGALYLYVSDRRYSTLAGASGKKIAVLNNDKAQLKLVQKIGGKPVNADLMSVGAKFNTHQVDIMVGPAVMAKPFELYKGMTSADGKLQGALVRVPILQFTGTILVHKNKFNNPDANQKIREYVYSQIGTAYKYIDNAEKTVDPKLWLDISAKDKLGFIALMKTARIELGKSGIYDKEMLHLLKNVRCKTDPSRSECPLNDE